MPEGITMNLAEALEVARQEQHTAAVRAEAMQTLVGEIERLVLTLRWYANKENYDLDNAPGEWAGSEFTEDMGNRARAALRLNDHAGRHTPVPEKPATQEAR